MEVVDHALALVVAERHVVFGNLEAGNRQAFEQCDQAIHLIAVPGVFKQDAAGEWHHAGIEIEFGGALDHIAGNQQCIHRVNLGVVDVVGCDIQQVGNAAFAAGPAEGIGSEVDHRGDAATARLGAALRQREFFDGHGNPGLCFLYELRLKQRDATVHRTAGV